ncbi:MAG: hypothetical protein R2939_22685 [Kofleriaceae bacterium]
MATSAVAALTSFLERFVTPLVAGGEMHVGRPLPIAALDDFDGALPEAALAADVIDDARTRVLTGLVSRPPPMILERDDLALAMGLHDALLLAHPDVDQLGVTDGQRRRLAGVAQSLVAQPLTREPRRLLARHALLHNVFAITRVDLHLSWWTGRARFQGQPAPERLTRWRRVRRVHEETRRAAVDELLCSDAALPITAALMRRTPLTMLLTDHPAAPPVHWEEVAFILRDRTLARAVAHGALRGEGGRAQLARPARLTAAFEQMLERTPRPADVRAVAALLVYVAGLACVLERRLGADEPSPLLAAGQQQPRPRGLAAFLALPSALARVAPALAVPPGIAADDELAARWRVHRAQAAQQVGEPVIEALAERLGRALLTAPTPTPAAGPAEVATADGADGPAAGGQAPAG